MRLPFFKGVILGAITAVLALIAATALAGTGVGAVFNLGTTNRVNHTSRLQGTARGTMLSISNKGRGGALSLHTSPFTPPLKVNSRTTVPNLSANNADHLGGAEPAPPARQLVDLRYVDVGAERSLPPCSRTSRFRSSQCLVAAQTLTSDGEP